MSGDEYMWRKRIVTETPDGHLVVKNSFFENLIKSKKVYLAHITYNLDSILKNRRIFSSSGCLMGKHLLFSTCFRGR